MNESIALITPWPPDHTGIADFSRDLAIGLVEAGYRVDVFTNVEAPLQTDGVTIHCVEPDWAGKEIVSYAYRLFQLGNNKDFHGWMLKALARFPGIVQVHDIVLHHLLAGLTWAEGNSRDYLHAITDWYGEADARKAEASLSGSVSLIWETVDVVNLPLFEFFLQYAEGVLLHSQYAARQIAYRLPRLPQRRIMQTYRHRVLPARTELKRIGIFGGVHENKKLDWILEAFGYLHTYLEGIDITVVGSVSNQCEDLLTKAETLPHASIRFLGRVDEAMFIAELERTDLCISLRHPTMGETSAIVMRAIQLGIPTLVSDTGWYAELPREVMKAPLDNTPHFISSVIHRFVTEPQSFIAWAARCAELPSALKLSHRHMCDEVIEFLRSYRAERMMADLMAQKLVDIGFIGHEIEANVLATLRTSLFLEVDR